VSVLPLPGTGRVGPAESQVAGLHRHCSGCARETEHVAWSHDGRASIASIRWPAAHTAGGTTICLDCGQWRAAQAFSFLSLIVWFTTFVLGVITYHRLTRQPVINEGPG